MKPLCYFFSLLCVVILPLVWACCPLLRSTVEEGVRFNNPYLIGKELTQGHDCACCQSDLVRVFRSSSHCPRHFVSPPPKKNPKHFPLQVCQKNLHFASICKEEKENLTNSSQQTITNDEWMKGLSTDGYPLPQYRFAQCELSTREHVSPFPDRELSVLSLHISSYLHMAHVSPIFLWFSTSKDYILVVFLHAWQKSSRETVENWITLIVIAGISFDKNKFSSFNISNLVKSHNIIFEGILWIRSGATWGTCSDSR